MPIHWHPMIRSLEEALESEGLIQTMDSLGVTEKKLAETAGTSPKVVPVAVTRIIRGDSYTAS
jgi:hypothetical protein